MQMDQDMRIDPQAGMKLMIGQRSDRPVQHNYWTWVLVDCAAYWLPLDMTHCIRWRSHKVFDFATSFEKEAARVYGSNLRLPQRQTLFWSPDTDLAGSWTCQ